MSTLFLGTEFPVEALKEWFVQARRDLPWRENRTPYRIWVSEVMLQQTQVTVVIPYFERWMKLFPTIEALAKAPLETVIKAWEGLGYYSRARYLHAGAQQIMQLFGGEIPQDREKLSQIKGLGPYTIGAILSFAFNQKAAAVDGNVMRVLSRFFAIHSPIDHSQTQKNIRELAEHLLPNDAPWLIVEGLIELGATVCKKEPTCDRCPLKRSCLAFRHQLQGEIPRKEKKVKVVSLIRAVAIVECQQKILVNKGRKGKVMADLYEFPFVEIQEESIDEKHVTDAFSKVLAIPLFFKESIQKQTHGFTRFSVSLVPFRFETPVFSEEGEWIPFEDLSSLPFSSGHRRILTSLTAKKA